MACLRLRIRIYVKAVQQEMQYRGQQYPCSHQENHAGEERVNRGEDLSAIADEWINRPHTSQYRGGVEQGIHSGQAPHTKL